MNIPYTIVMDLARTQVTSSIIISENDVNTRIVHLVMMNNGNPLDLSDVAAIQVKGIYEDDTSFLDGESAEVLLDDDDNKTNVIAYTLPADVGEHVGLATITVTLFTTSDVTNEDPDQQITAPEFYVKVKPQLYDLSERIYDGYWEGSGTSPGSGQSSGQEEEETTTTGGRVYYCTCETADYETTKVILSDEEIDMQAGTVLLVHMVEGNTLEGDEIDGFDIDGDVYPISEDYPELWANNEEHDILLFYDGEVLRCPSFRKASTEQYGMVMLSDDLDEGDDGDLATLGSVRTVYEMVQDLQQRVYYTACSNDADETEKELNLADIDLIAGTIIYVDFTNGNTVAGEDLDGITIGEDTYPVVVYDPDPWVNSGQHIATLVFDGESFTKTNYNPPQKTLLTESASISDNSQRVSIPNGNSEPYTKVFHVTAPFTGRVMVSAYIQFTNNSNGNRHADIRIAGALVNGSTVAATSGASIMLSLSAICEVEEGEEVALYAYQTAGSGTTLYAGGKFSALFTEE